MDSVKFNINESNQIRFKLHVQGTTSEPGATDPEFRFIISSRDISEATSGIGYVFPAKKEPDGMVSVLIPAMEGTLIKENKEYIGKMEVLMGSRYFTPSSMNIVFEKEFNITAEAVVDNKNKVIQETKNSNNNEPSVKAEAVTIGKPEIIKKSGPAPTIQKQIVEQPTTAKIAEATTDIKIKFTAEDIKRTAGDDKKLKRLIVERLAKQVSPKSENFIPLVEKTFVNIKTKLNKLSETNNKKKMDVEDLFDGLIK